MHIPFVGGLVILPCSALEQTVPVVRGALFALSELRNQGKLVGVISHIEEVGQKIPVRIEVKSGSAGGLNQIEGPGVTRG